MKSCSKKHLYREYARIKMCHSRREQQFGFQIEILNQVFSQPSKRKTNQFLIEYLRFEEKRLANNLPESISAV